MTSHGCFYYPPGVNRYGKTYLPQVGLNVHAAVLSSSSRTVFTQTYVNPSSKDPISEVQYSFPLYESSSIVGFTCHVGEEVIKGIVKPRKKADEVYQEAKAKGETAAIFDQSLDAADVFQTRVGNLPAGGKVVIEITLVAELKQDAQTNGPRYTIPVSIAPRYGAMQDNPLFPIDSSTSKEGQLSETSIKVDVVMEKESHICNVRSPSHPIEVELGRASFMSESTFEPCFASINLRKNVVMQEDFVLTINATKQDLPCAFLETHPTIENQRALMVSLIPKFGLPPDASEIIFVIDRSGSMEDKIPTLRSALEVFLKSLPIGIHFNIVSFGSGHDSLWPHSKPCDKENLAQALQLIRRVQADYGGTEILSALKSAVDMRYKDKMPEILLLTDGQAWNQEEMFAFVKKANEEVSARFFSLGIGDSASHSLIEGISRAGMGFSQSVLNYEELDKKVIRMLKGALMSRLYNTTLDMKLPQGAESGDFIEIEAPKLSDDREGTTAENTHPVSLFNENYEESEGVGKVDQPLPKLSVPSIIQVPTDLPPLFPFIRSTVYVLLSPDAPSIPERITLRAESKNGPLELDIPVQDAGKRETIHQLAAKKAMSELEEFRGWISVAKDTQGELLSTKWESRMGEIVQAECERLGVKFQIAGKHCSFVAVRDNKGMESFVRRVRASRFYYNSDSEEDEEESEEGDFVSRPRAHRGGGQFFEEEAGISEDESSAGFDSDDNGSGANNFLKADSTDSSNEDMTFDAGDQAASSMQSLYKHQMYHSGPSAPPVRAKRRKVKRKMAMASSQTVMAPAPACPSAPIQLMSASFNLDTSLPEEFGAMDEPPMPTSPLQKLVYLQQFEGYWKWSDDLLQTIGLDAASTKQKAEAEYKALANDDSDVWSHASWEEIFATCLVVRYLETQLADSEDVWELLKEKADAWTANSVGSVDEKYQPVLKELIGKLQLLF